MTGITMRLRSAIHIFLPHDTGLERSELERSRMFL